jgi:phosphomannomutase
VLKSFGTRIHSIDHLDGVTVDVGDGSWFNLRMSNTEPLLRLNVEARSTAEVDEIVGLISQIVQAEVSSDTGAAT